MLLRAQPIFDAFDAIEKKIAVLLDPAGRTFDQAYAEELAQEEELIFICGHYEGYDRQIKDAVTDEDFAGDYVWQVRTCCYDHVDATVLDSSDWKKSQSPGWQFIVWSSGISPSTTRPYEDTEEWQFPMSSCDGHHENIRQWRLYPEFEKKTLERRQTY